MVTCCVSVSRPTKLLTCVQSDSRSPVVSTPRSSVTSNPSQESTRSRSGRAMVLPRSLFQHAVATILLFLVSLTPSAVANTALPADYTPLTYGSCTNAPVDTDEFAPNGVYSTANTDHFIAESVNLQSDDVGATCGYTVPRSEFSRLNVDEDVYIPPFSAAASQGLFNGVRLLPDNLESMEMFCGELTQYEGNATSGNQCAQMCGVCVLITGTAGNQIYTVNQLATIQEHDSLGRGIALHLGGSESVAGQPHAIRGSVTGARKDIQFTRVPCPVAGPMYLIVRSFGNDQNVSFTPMNHRFGIRSMFLERAGDDVALPRTLGNEFRYSPGDFSWQSGSIFEAGSPTTVNIRIVSQIDGLQLEGANREISSVTCENVAVNIDSTGDSTTMLIACETSTSEAVNFAEACVNTNACDFTNDPRSMNCNPLPPADGSGSPDGSTLPGATIGGIVGGVLAAVFVFGAVAVFYVRRRRQSATSQKRKRYAFDAGTGVAQASPSQRDPFGTVNTAAVVREDDVTSPYGEYGEPYDTAFVGPTTRVK